MARLIVGGIVIGAMAVHVLYHLWWIAFPLGYRNEINFRRWQESRKRDR